VVNAEGVEEEVEDTPVYEGPGLSEGDIRTLHNLYMMLFEYSLPMALTGSQAIGGATDASDYDIAVLADHNFDMINRELRQAGFRVSLTDSQNEGGDWLTESYKKGKINVLLTRTLSSFEDWKFATKVAIMLGLTDKEQRIALFDSVFEGRKDGLMRLMDVTPEEVINEDIISESEGEELTAVGEGPTTDASGPTNLG
jgi:hypothetical protein